jgi:hypothetical protein
MTDIDQIRRDVSLPAIAAQFGVDLAPNGNEFEACCPLHQERTPSFTIFPGKDGAWRFHCFGCGAKGDVIDFVSQVQGVTTAEAIRILNGDRRAGANIQPIQIEAKDPYKGITLLPPPEELAPDRKLVLYNPKRERTGNITPSAVWPYYQGGAVMGYVLRHDLSDGGKETPMVCWTRLPDGVECWSRFPFPKPRPLYGAERIQPETRQVIVAEGEKKVDAIYRATGRIAVSAAGGVNGGRHADWSALKGKKVLIWPDADPEGFKYLAELAELLADIASEIKFVDVAREYYEADDVRDSGGPASGQGMVHQDGRGPRLVRERGSSSAADGAGERGAKASGGRGARPRRAIDPTKGTSLSHADWLAGKLVPRGWDVADAERDGWDKPAIDGFMKHCSTEEAPEYPVGEPVGVGAMTEPAPEPPVPDDPREPLETLRHDWCFVGGRSVFRDVNTGAELKVGAFDLMFRRLIPMMDFLPNGTVLNKPKEVSASDWLTGYGFGQTVQDTIYLPQEGQVMEIAGVRYLNSYLPGQVPKAARSYAGHWAVDVWQGHLQNILPDDWKMLLEWLAYNVQNPGKKVLWAPIIKGTQGDGKTSIGNMMGAVMGSNNAKVVGPESLHSDFNGYAEGSCVAFLEEIRVKGHNRHDAMNKLKPLITNSVIEVVRKGQDGRNVPNVTNYMAFTNFEDALVIDANDRRWGVFFTRFVDREAMAAAGVGAEYWNKLHDAYAEHADVLRAWLLDVDVSEFDPKAAPPITAAKMSMIKSSISNEAVTLSEMIALGYEGVAPHAVATDCLNAAVKASHQQALATTRMAQALVELGWRPLEKTIKWNGKSRRVYIDGRYNWPDERLVNGAVRDMLDATLPGAMNVDPLEERVW